MITGLWMLWVVPVVVMLGYASHRASLCTVRAVADVLEARRFVLFSSFARAVLWAMLLTVPATWFFPERFPVPEPQSPLWTGLLGGLSFGFGAALNRGCSFSTLQRLADGDWRMLASLGGFLGGSLLWYLLPPVVTSTTTEVPETCSAKWLLPLMVALAVWALLETSHLWRRRAGLTDLRHIQHFSPAATALILGIGGGLLYLGFGPWTYTNSLQQTAGALIGERLLPPALQLALIPALLGGMLLSAWQRGAWQVRKPVRGWVANLVGGVFMGFGGSLIPGGNDTLLLRLIPSMTPNSLWNYLMLIAGVVVGLLLTMRPGHTPCESADCGSVATPRAEPHRP